MVNGVVTGVVRRVVLDVEVVVGMTLELEELEVVRAVPVVGTAAVDQMVDLSLQLLGLLGSTEKGQRLALLRSRVLRGRLFL